MAYVTIRSRAKIYGVTRQSHVLTLLFLEYSPSRLLHLSSPSSNIVLHTLSSSRLCLCLCVFDFPSFVSKAGS